MAKKPVFYMLLFSGFIFALFLIMQPLQVYLFQKDIPFLFPSGSIAVEQRNLLFIIQALMLLVIFPVYILTFIFSWRYRADNKKAKYDPDLIDNVIAEYIWWGFPLIMVIIAGTITWIQTEKLDPYKSIVAEKKEKIIEVVALQWKWLFIYPEENIATVNYLKIPVNTPIRFLITADAPMNSFWIPNLGGQIYAMPGMRTELNLIANEEGNFRGSSANISGEGFADMYFTTSAVYEEDYDKWVEKIKGSESSLDLKSYKELAAPGINPTPLYYQLSDKNLFNQILMKFMHPQKES
jgi:cytochrome o ubiquinol oxidase subunit 2